MKYLKHTSEAPETLETYACNMHVMQRPDLFLQHPDETLENISLKKLKYLEHMIAT
jgi:hypothetical protein